MSDNRTPGAEDQGREQPPQRPLMPMAPVNGLETR